MTEVMDKGLQQTVLLVDDEASVRECVKTVLQGQDLHVLEATDGVDALGVLRCFGRAVDLLITDVKMPRMIGTDLVQAVRSDYPNTPVVYISGEPLECELHNPPLRIVFLQKPFRPQVLLDSVRRMLSASATSASVSNSARISNVSATA